MEQVPVLAQGSRSRSRRQPWHRALQAAGRQGAQVRQRCPWPACSALVRPCNLARHLTGEHTRDEQRTARLLEVVTP